MISEIPFNLFYGGSWFYPYHQNVMFTLLLGLLAIAVIDRARKEKTAKSTVKSVLLLIPISLGAFVGFPDYGFWGYLTVIMFYLFRNFRFAWILQLASMILLHLVLPEGQNIIIELFGKTFEFAVQGFAVLALIPIWLYSGKKGKNSKIIQYRFSRTHDNSLFNKVFLLVKNRLSHLRQPEIFIDLAKNHCNNR